MVVRVPQGEPLQQGEAHCHYYSVITLSILHYHGVQGLGSSSDYVVTLLNTQPSPEASDADIDYTGYDDYYDGSEPRH